MKIIQEKAFDTIMSAVDTLVELVKPTYGASGNKIIIGKGYGVSVLDDGVQIAKDLELEDEAENYVLKLIREVAVKTNERVGDGTTSTLILLQAILKEAQKSNKTKPEIVKELELGLTEAVAMIIGESRSIKTKEDLEKVARISFDNAEIANLLSEIIFEIGENGLIDVQASQRANIESEIVTGYKTLSGFISPYMANDGDKCVIEDAVILTTDKSFFNNAEIVPVMEMVLKGGKSNLVVFCKDFSGEALTTAILNKIKGSFKLVAIKANEQDMNDICLLTGSKQVLTDTKVEDKDFGFAKKVVSRLDDTTIIDGGGDKIEISEVIEELKKDKINDRRVANLTNAVAIIRVGAKTESEAKALQFKVEDASNAIKVAYKGGVVAGAGTTLAGLNTSSKILNLAMQYPNKQLKINMGEFEMNDDIIDPTEVVIAGLESAVSIAKLLLETRGIIYDIKQNDK
jgi:chaperonin GroEL